MFLSVFLKGLLIGFSLILAIGPQNAFVLRQGLRDEHIFLVCLSCAVSDAILIMVGTTGFQEIARVLPWLDPAMRFGGAVFLFCYGAKSFWASWRSREVLTAAARPPQSLSSAIATSLALTWMNPHVYVDTLMLMGAISTQFNPFQYAFSMGAIAASLIFFFALGYGALLLRPIFAQPRSWQILEALIGTIMWTIAIELYLGR